MSVETEGRHAGAGHRGLVFVTNPANWRTEKVRFQNPALRAIAICGSEIVFSALFVCLSCRLAVARGVLHHPTQKFSKLPARMGRHFRHE